MKNSRVVEIAVGIFMVLVLLGLVLLAFRVSGTQFTSGRDMYELTADFDNIGGLKERSEVSISGVAIGFVESITLNHKTFRAQVHLLVDKHYQIPVDSSANIYTHGLLGSNYIAVIPGFETENLQNNGVIETTHSALVLENLIGQLIYNNKEDKDSHKQTK